MKPFLLTLFAVASLWADNTVAGPAPQVPRKAPELIMQLPDKQLLLSNFKGYTCVLAFMSTTCPHCQHLATVLAQLAPELAPKGVQMLGVVFNPEAITERGNFQAVFAHNAFPVGMSTDAIVAEFVQHPPGIHYIPMLVFIDKNGIIRSQHLAATDSNYFREDSEVQNIKADLDRIFKEPTIQLPGSKAAVKKDLKKK
jgi:thiol-disulfide isomerase/thioredoxin